MLFFCNYADIHGRQLFMYILNLVEVHVSIFQVIVIYNPVTTVLIIVEIHFTNVFKKLLLSFSTMFCDFFGYAS
jgi:hypothetical protein